MASAQTKLEFFAHSDYRAALRSRAEDWKKAVPAATFQSLAKACRVQKAYLSRVFQGSADLSHDQIFLACEHLGIVGLERDFLLTLHDHGRSEVPARKRALAGKLATCRAAARETVGHISVTQVAHDDSERLAAFFLDPDAQLVHTFLMLDRYRRQPKSLAPVLGLSAERVEHLIELLRRMNLLSVTQDGLSVTSNFMHLPRDSPLFVAYRALLRQRVLADQTRTPERGGYSLSLLFTATQEVEAAMRARLLAALEEFEGEVRAAPSEEVYYLGIDLRQYSE